MPPAHRQDDARNCGATTIVQGQNTTFVDGKLWAVKDDPNTHGAGGLIPSGSTVNIQGKLVIVNQPDNANPDLADHPNPATAAGSPKTNAYG